MKISSLFEKKKPVLSFEIYPPKTETPLADASVVLDGLSALRPDFISVTFGTGTSGRSGKTIDIAALIKEKYGIETMAHLTCVNHGHAEIEGLLRAMRDAGIENILALRGDKAPDMLPKTDFAHAADLVAFLAESGEFSVSGACYPEGHPETRSRELSIRHLKQKVDAGANHLISQLFFRNEDFFTMLTEAREAGITVPIEAGIMPVTNRARIERMAALCGAHLPGEITRMLNRYSDNSAALAEAGIAYAAHMIEELLAHGVDGIHLYTMNDPAVTGKICKALDFA
jgi:methylenetetrahydrofolate reductase (NADPH)